MLDFLHMFWTVVDLFLHIDQKLGWFVQNYGAWVYGLLFLIVFCETGLVVTPFLPGDSLLFAAGAFAALGSMDLVTVYFILLLAAILGDGVNYHLGHHFGKRVFAEDGRFIRKAHLEKTQAFYVKYGGRAVVLARFVPIVRTLAPFVAGVGTMSYRTFLFYNVFGAFLWVTSLVGAGYLFGNLPFVRDNFSHVILGIIAVSLLPMAWEWWKDRCERARSHSAAR